MAIAALLDTESADWSEDLFGASWPRPPLQLVTDACDGALDPRAGKTGLRTGTDVTRRRARRAVVRRRRRAVAFAATAAGLVVGLALPLAVLGGAPADAHPGVHGTVYVVRPGDSLWSIARRFDGGADPRALDSALVKETGSEVVVPGERIAIPRASPLRGGRALAQH